MPVDVDVVVAAGGDPTRQLDLKETTMDPHYSDGIAAAWTMLVRHAMRPRVRSAAGTRELPVPTLSTGRKWWCQLHSGCPAASIPACPGRP
jgi:hypothetical protein